MNERIKELMEQAMELVDPYALEGEFGPRQLNEEKFAELIVKECAKSAYDWYQHHDQLHWDPATHILAHFGVEE